MYEILDVLDFLPKANLDEFVDELLNSEAEAFVSDFYLNEYRIDVAEFVNYTGAELIDKILTI